MGRLGSLRRRFTGGRVGAPKRSIAALASISLIAGLLTTGAVVAAGEAPRAEAAPSPTQQWVTNVSAVTGTGAATARTLTFESGVTATETTTAMTGACAPFGAGAAMSGVSEFLEPDPPAAARAANANCAGPTNGSNSRTSSVEFSQPIIAPVIHVANLDASRLTVSGGGISLTQLAKNNALEVSGTTLNSTLQQALNPGCAANDGSNPNGGCGSFRLTSAAPVSAFALENSTIGSTVFGSGENDSWNYTLSYPTAPLTKEFSPASIRVGETSQLTFTIANPSTQAAPTQPTLSPMGFTDTLPAGVTIADDSVVATESCGAATVDAAAGATSLTASGVSVAAGATCEITVNVTSDTAGSYTNSTENLTTTVANLVPNADTTLTVTEAPQSPVPFACTAGAPGTLFQQQPTDVFTVDLATGASQQVGDDISPANLNAAGYNPADDYMYAYGNDGSFYRIGSDWIPQAIGLPSNWSTVPSQVRADLNVGEFDGDGHYWVTNSNVAPYGWAEIDLSDPAAATYMQVIGSGTFTMPAGWLLGPDWGYNVQDGDLYSVAYAAGVAPARLGLVRFDTESRTTSIVRDLGTLQEPDGEYASALFGAVYTDPDGFLYASNNVTGGIWRFEMATGDANYFAAGPASGLNDGARCFNSPLPIDFGDAPDSYGTTLAADGPRHNIPGYDADAGTAPLMLGSAIDSEADGQPSPLAEGDDLSGIADEDALSDIIVLQPGATSVTVPVAVTNDLSVSANLYGWIDIDGNGRFDADEAATAVVPSGATSVDLEFAGFAPAQEGSFPFLRLRLTTDELVDDLATAVDERALGSASNGEVEDHRAQVPAPIVTCTSDTSMFNTAFDRNGGSLPAGSRDFGWQVGVGDASGYQSVASYEPAYVIPPVAGAWVESPYGNADWIAHNANGAHAARIDLYFRYDFTISDLVQLDGFALPMDFYADNSIPEVWVNGVAQSEFEESLPQTTVDPYRHGGFFEGGQASTRLSEGFQHGENSIIVRVASDPGYVGFLAQILPEPVCADFGDAPESYGTTAAANGPRHGVVPDLTLGALIDADADGQPSPLADGDDLNGIADEDAIADDVVLQPGATSVIVPVAVTNDLGVPANLYGWIDIDGNGTFDADEAATAVVPSGATSVDLEFTGLASAQDGSFPFLRLRLTTDELVDDPATSVDERALGVASNGEVEDHRAQVATLVPISCVAPFVETFGTGTGYGEPLPAGQTTYRYEGSGVVNDGEYGLVSELPGAAGGWWHVGEDRTPDDENGRLMLVNADYTAGIFFQRTFTQLSPGATYDFGAWVTNANNAGSAILPNVQFRVVDPETDEVLASVDTGDISNKPSLEWERFSLQFTATQPTVRLEIANNADGGNGNDLALDDISFSPVCEFGDAPDSYGTTIAAGGAGHIATGPTLGVERDTEPDGQPNEAADGDDTTGTPNDEDGVAAPITTSIGGTTTVTVTATNDSDEDVTLAGWLDLDGSGTFDADERVLVTVPAGSGTADYEIAFPVLSTTENTYARFRIYGGIESDPQPTGTAAAGEVEDYLVTVLEPSLAIAKSSDATADTRPGDTVTYTVTAENTGEGDYTAENPAVVLDDLAGVLDDARYNGDAAADTGDAPAFESPLLSWVGELGAGETVTITYTVTLGSSGDGSVRNVAFAPGCDPADESCDTTTPACDPPQNGFDPATGRPCAETELLLPSLRHSKVADTTELPADGGVVTYTVTVENTGPGAFTDAAPGTMTDDLTHVLDDADYNGDARADRGTATFDEDAGTLSWSGALAAGEVATITYSVTYDDSTGDNVLLNLACVPAHLADDPADACRSVQIPGSALQDRKSVEPADGSSVVAGQEVTYTLYFENTGEADATVDTFDDLSGVLDDAVLTGQPTTSDEALSAVVNGSRIDVTGTVAPGQTLTVSYTVTVRPFGEQGDHVLGNVLGGDEGCAAFDPTCRTENPVRHVSVEKSSDAAEGVNTGDVVTYTVTIENDGEGDYTEAEPAIVRDDLSGVLDDATYRGDASASAGTVSFEAPQLTWTGALASGETVTVTYSVTVTNAGDHELENVAGPVCSDPEVCDPPVSVVTLLPYIVPDKQATPDSGTGLQAGDEVTYTLSWTNHGGAAGAIDSTDDLSDVLDDADVTAEPVSSDESVTAVRDGDEIRITGTIGAGATVTVTYTVTVKADGERGDNIASNVLTPDVPPYECAEGVADCDPFEPPTTRHPIGEIEDRKTVDPSSGTSVVAGQQVTYTLHFENTGEADATVDTFDDLSGVLDDAVLTGQPTTSDEALSAVVNGSRIDVTGTVAPGETLTVSYTVTVRPFGEQGDHVLGNVLGGDEGCAADDATCRTENPVRHVSVEKSSDAAEGVNTGDVVTYTVTIENDGEGDYTEAEPAIVRDDLSGVLDDATYGGDAAASAGTASFEAPHLTWTGALAAGETVTLTYSVVVTNTGDHELENVAGPVCSDPEVCDPPVSVVTPLPHIVPSKTAAPESGAGLQAGDEVTYTLSWTNDGGAAGAIDSTDDLSDVLDDADVTAEPVSSDESITAVRDGERIRVTGTLGAGETVTVTYTVTVKADGERGDNVASNVLIPDVPPYECAEGADDCEPFQPPITEHPIGQLAAWKTVDPASGSTVQAGQELTYTLHFENTGEADVDVHRDDVLTDVLDDASVTSAPVSSDEALTASAIEDGRFTVTGTLAAGAQATVSYTVTVRGDGERGDDRLGNHLVPSGEEPTLGECAPVDPERPDCTVNLVSAVVASKSADPASGTEVSQGREVTYTLTFENVSAAGAADAAIDYTDHLAGVLDDAALTEGPVSSDAGVTAVREGDTIRVTGAVASGATVTVTYTVTVHDYDEQGDHLLGNVLAVTGEEPTCAPGSMLCTEHELVPPASLPQTGAEVAWTVVLSGLLLLLIGGGAIMVSRRREHEEAV